MDKSRCIWLLDKVDLHQGSAMVDNDWEQGTLEAHI